MSCSPARHVVNTDCRKLQSTALVSLSIRMTFIASVMNVADLVEIEATLMQHSGDLTCLQGKQTENNKVLVLYVL